MLERERTLPVPEASPRRRSETYMPPVGDKALQEVTWPAPTNPASLQRPPGDRGRPLRGDLRERLVPMVGPGVDRVRIHDDEHADRVAAAYGADAVTIGEETFLASRGSTRPENIALLAHELWHATEPGRTGGAPHRSTTAGAAEEERAALAVEQLYLDGVMGTPVAQPPAPHHATSAWPPTPSPSAHPGTAPAPHHATSAWPLTPPVSAPPTPSPSAHPGTAPAAPAARPMTARPDRHAELSSAALDPGALRDVVREVLHGELRDQAARQLRADLAIELERGA
nr:hypothetical protein KitaXyl93_54740 [Kitasatospora sp. Xyl93]